MRRSCRALPDHQPSWRWAIQWAGWLAAGETFESGSDSNVRISLTEELRTLEYSQRLRDIARNVMVEKDGSVGQFLYVGAALGGAQALGRKSGQIAVGNRADLTAIDLSHPTLCALRPDHILDGLAFAAPDRGHRPMVRRQASSERGASRPPGADHRGLAKSRERLDRRCLTAVRPVSAG